MSAIVKSFSVANNHNQSGDMFYIKHDSSNFTIIDCCLNEERKKEIVGEINRQREEKDITRFISTHPDEDHICGLKYLDEEIDIVNFYCVENQATKDKISESFQHYCKMRDNEKKHFYVYEGCTRKWLNINDPNDEKNYGSSEIHFLWPDRKNNDYKQALSAARDGSSFNNISPIFTYSLNDSAKIMWMGDMEHVFQEKIKTCVSWPKIDILFAPHHGRKSGRVSEDILKELQPKIIVVGEAPSEDLNYYAKYNTITQNSAGDIVFVCDKKIVHVYVSNGKYSVDYLSDKAKEDSSLGKYIGSFDTGERK